ncbi:MAG: heme NO-binding domain-containing protein [Gammaproteobacteria bacterium]
MIHKSIKDLVTKTFGENIWNRIAEDAAVDPEDFLSLRHYDDEIVYRLITKSAEHLEMNTEDLLVAFGEHWVLATASEHYGQLIQAP